VGPEPLRAADLDAARNGRSQAPERTGQSAIYDAARDRVILFGGYSGGPPNAYLSDAWELSLSTNTWSLLAPIGTPPGGREGHGALYDPIAQRMLVFGGHYEGTVRGFWNDVWELNLVDDDPAWTELHSSGGPPGARSSFATVYDPVRRRMLIHGGLNSESGIEPDEPWALSLDGELVWSKIEPVNRLRGRSYPVDVYDPVGDRLLACGGGQYPVTSELSLSAPAQWRPVLPLDPLPTPGHRLGNAVLRDSRRDHFAALGGSFSIVDSTVWSFDPSAFSPWQPLSSVFTPDLDLLMSGDHTTVAAYDSLDDRFIARDGFRFYSMLAGGQDGWTNLGPAPPFEDLNFELPGHDAGISIDTRTSRLLVTGGLIPAGHAAYGTTKGVWSLPLTSDPQWKQIGVLPQPYGSAMHASFYDPIRDRLIVVGGIWIGGKFQVRRDHGPTVWTTPLESTLHWTDRSTLLGELPPGSPIAQAAYDPQHDRIFLFADSRVWVRAVDDTGPWTDLTFTSPRPSVKGAVAHDPARDQILALFAQASGSDGVQAWALTYGPPSASAIESSASSSGITLKWFSPAAIGRRAMLERSERGSPWIEVASLAFDLHGLANFTDPDVLLDHTYYYRARVDIGTSAWRSDAVTVAMLPSLKLAISATPNPALGRLQVALSLPAAGPARLEAYDSQGRLRAWRDIGALGAGPHTVVLGEEGALQPGLYVVRLNRGNETRTARVTLVR
jgi:hypothetical protein